MSKSDSNTKSPFSRANKPTNPVLSLGLSIRLVVVLVLLNIVLLVGMVFILVQIQSISARKPWVIGRDTMNQLVDLQLDAYQLDRAAVEQYLEYTLSRLYFIEKGKSEGIEDIRYLVADPIVQQHLDTLRNKRDEMLQKGFSLQVMVTGLDLSSPETFVINHKAGRVYATVYGSVIVKSSDQSYHMDTKWEVDCRIVAPSERNRWGILLTQLFEKSPDTPIFKIPSNLRRSGERVPWENPDVKGF